MNPRKISFRRSLKTRVTLFTLTIFLISIWSLAFYANKTLRQGLQDIVSDQQYSTATVVAKQIEEEFETRFKSLQSMASLINLATLDNMSSSQAFLESHPVFQNLFNGGTFITRIDGVAIASLPLSAGRVGANFLDRDHISAAIKEGKTTISEPVIGKKLMTPVFAMATPLHDVDGKIIGALAGVVDLSTPNFLDKITQNHYAKTGGYLLIAPQRKLIITGTDKSYNLQPIPAPGINPLFDRYAQGFEGSGIVVDARGVEVLSSSKQISSAKWLLVVRIPTAEAFAPIYSTQRRIILISVLLTLLAGSLTWWNLTRQLAPILNTATILDAHSDNTQSLKSLPISNPDEIGKLISSFNHLLDTLSHREEEIRRSRDELEIRVKERTCELAKIVDILKEQAELLDLAHDAILVHDSDGIIRYWNCGAEETYGWKKQEVLGKKCHILLQAEFPISREDTVSCATATGQWEGELKHITQTGVPIIVASRWGVRRNIKGDLLGFLEINRDITERKKLLEEREQLIYDLQKALANVKMLSGLIPICASCKMIRDDKGYWNQIESYIKDHSEANFSHGICPECAKKLYPDLGLDFGPMLEKKNIN